MATDLPLLCECGKLRGTATILSPEAGTRIVCYCGDCQAFARFLGRPGITDRWGGTDIVQLAPSQVRVEHEEGALRCVRLSDKGMHRWYCGHCKTPVANTLGARVPFVGLIRAFMNPAGAGLDLEALLGKPIGYLQKGSAVGGPPPVERTSMLRVGARSVKNLARWWIRGEGARSPFFDEKRAPRVTPRVLTPEERQALRGDGSTAA